MIGHVWRLSDVARQLGVSKQQRVHQFLVEGQLLVEGRLPAPAGEDHRGRYWRLSEVRAWARGWGSARCAF